LSGLITNDSQKDPGSQKGHGFAARSGPFALDDIAAYARWREAKLAHYPRHALDLAVEIADLHNPTSAEQAAILAHCRTANMAVYANARTGRDAQAVRPALLSFGRAFGLVSAEDHRSAGADGIVGIEMADQGGRAGYIPYSDRRIAWHTDGYYNFHGPERCIQAMLLHCVRDAEEGGVNALLDQDIAYIRLRDRDPSFIAALMHPQAMTIPVNEEPNGRVRAANTGPVFAVHPVTGALIMRYTARTRSIVWRDDAVTRAAVQFLEQVLASDPLILTHRLSPGQGLICNNVLHTRTGFSNPAAAEGRLLYRIRYHDRIEDGARRAAALNTSGG
jgi:alpha-ketoglutarate-dependent taurine dioxygenase